MVSTTPIIYRTLFNPPPWAILVGQGSAVDPEAISTIPQYHGPARDAIATAARYVDRRSRDKKGFFTQGNRQLCAGFGELSRVDTAFVFDRVFWF